MRITFILTIMLICTPLVKGHAQTELDAYVKDVLESNLALKNLEAKYRAQTAMAKSSGILPDPQFVYTYMGESVQTKVGPQNKKLGVRQALPFLSKLRTKRRLADLDSQIAFARYDLAGRGMVEKSKSLYYDLVFAKFSKEILESRKRSLAMLKLSALRLYEASKVEHKDLLKLDMVLGRLDERLLKLDQQYFLLERSFNDLLNNKDEERLQLDYSSVVETDLSLPDFGSLSVASFDLNPHRLMAQLNRDKSKLDVSLARQGFIPDFSFMADYIDIGDGTTKLPDDGKDAWMVGVGVRVPLWFWKQKSQLDSKLSMRSAAEAKLDDTDLFLNSQIESLEFKLKTTTQLVELYKYSIQPSARQIYEVALKNYEIGELKLKELIAAEKEYISSRIATVKLYVDYYKLMARLEYLIGQPIIVNS